jgi:hypothetical protein
MTADAKSGKLSDAARQLLERFLCELRISLQRCRSVDRNEVEADVKQHIDQELADAPAPVSGSRRRRRHRRTCCRTGSGSRPTGRPAPVRRRKVAVQSAALELRLPATWVAWVLLLLLTVQFAELSVSKLSENKVAADAVARGNHESGQNGDGGGLTAERQGLTAGA